MAEGDSPMTTVSSKGVAYGLLRMHGPSPAIQTNYCPPYELYSCERLTGVDFLQFAFMRRREQKF